MHRAVRETDVKGGKRLRTRRQSSQHGEQREGNSACGHGADGCDGDQQRTRRHQGDQHMGVHRHLVDLVRPVAIARAELVEQRRKRAKEAAAQGKGQERSASLPDDASGTGLSCLQQLYADVRYYLSFP